MAQRLVVVGADAAGMSAASQALRTARAAGRDLDVLAVEMTDAVSYSACGIPYWMAGDVAAADELVARTAAEHRANGIGLRLRTEATAVEPRGRISINDLGLWNDEQAEALARIARFVKSQGAAFSIQLAHAGRKAWSGTKGQGPEQGVAPSAIPFDSDWATPEALDLAGIDRIVRAFGDAARRAAALGCDSVEIHSAHGYLLHEFLSPLSNQRTDEYGGSLENRTRLLKRVYQAVREWVKSSGCFALDERPGRYTMWHVITSDVAFRAMGYRQLDLYVPIRVVEGAEAGL